MSSLSDWIGAQELRGASMGLDDPSLDDRTAALVRRQDALLAESERLDDAWAATVKALRDVRGVGEAESRAVTVTVDAQNRVVDIALTQRALRLGSTDRLRKALLDACAAAVADAAGKLREATGVDPDVDPLAVFFDGLPEIAAVMPPAPATPSPTRSAPPGTEDHHG